MAPPELISSRRPATLYAARSRSWPAVSVAGLIGIPVLAGLAMAAFPAFGVMPAIAGYGGASLPLADILAEPGLVRSMALQLAASLAATALSLSLAMLFVAAAINSGLGRIVQACVPPLLALPHAAASLALLLLITPSGFLIRLLHGLTGAFSDPPMWALANDPHALLLTALLVYKETPFLILMALAAVTSQSAGRAGMLAASLGYGSFAGFFLLVAIPLYRQMRMSVLIVLVYAVSVTDLALLIGPNLPPLLSVRILQWMSDPDLQKLYLAGAGLILLLALTGVALLGWLVLEAVASRLFRSLAIAGRRWRNDRWLQAGLRALGAGVLLLTALMILVLLLWSFAASWTYPDILPSRLTLENWRAAGTSLWQPLALTVEIGAGAGLAALFIVVALLHLQGEKPLRKPLLLLVFLPLLVPQLAVSAGLQFLVILSGAAASRWLLMAAHMVFVCPYLYLTLAGPWERFDRRYEQLAASLGHSPLAILLRIRLPMLLRPILASLAVGFAVSVGLYLPTALIGAGRITTVVTEAVALGSGSDRRMIGLYALVQMMLGLAGFALALAVPALLWRDRRGMRV